MTDDPTEAGRGDPCVPPPRPADELDYEDLWRRATPFASYLQPEMKYHSFWEGVHRHANVPDWAVGRGRALGPLRLLTLAEDWCGDAVNAVPVAARLAEAVPDSELRILPRDLHPDVMDRYLTDGTRSIPIVIGLDESYRPTGHWGPRPRQLQEWVLANLRTMPKKDLYRETRRWYARDAGATILDELLTAIGG